jgi:epsilon-lactone hydrolase
MKANFINTMPTRLLALGVAVVAAAIVLSEQYACAQTAAPGPREVPARLLPVPTTVSPQMQKIIGAPISPTWNVLPKTAEEWKAQVNAAAAEAVRRLPAMRDELRVKSGPLTIWVEAEGRLLGEK